MGTSTAVLWDLNVTNQEVVKESVGWDPGISLSGGPEAVYSPDLRTRVEAHHYGRTLWFYMRQSKGQRV